MFSKNQRPVQRNCLAIAGHGRLGGELCEPLKPCSPLCSSSRIQPAAPQEPSPFRRASAHDRLGLTRISRFLFNGLAVCFVLHVDQTGLKLKDPPAFASVVLGLKALAACPAVRVFADTIIGLATWTMTPVQGCSVFTATVSHY